MRVSVIEGRIPIAKGASLRTSVVVGTDLAVRVVRHATVVVVEAAGTAAVEAVSVTASVTGSVEAVPVDAGAVVAGEAGVRSNETGAAGVSVYARYGVVIEVAVAIVTGTVVAVGGVVVEVAAPPVSAVEAYAEVAPAVVDAAVVANGGSPVAGVPVVAVAGYSPSSRGSIGLRLRRGVEPMLLVPTGSHRLPMPSNRGSTCSRRRGLRAECSQGRREGPAGPPVVRRTEVRPLGVRRTAVCRTGVCRPEVRCTEEFRIAAVRRTEECRTEECRTAAVVRRTAAVVRRTAAVVRRTAVVRRFGGLCCSRRTGSAYVCTVPGRR